uniref:RRM domain-containing protein n=1 Tax=Macrostomum lignano TaxID=282301 RepID=A0A1I8G9N4_9PLAT
MTNSTNHGNSNQDTPESLAANNEHLAKRCNVVQVTNISPQATRDQIKSLMGYLGHIDELVIYPNNINTDPPPSSLVAYIRYNERENALLSLHLNNTVLLDRALIVLPVLSNKIPDEAYAMKVMCPEHTSAGVFPKTADWPLDVISMVVGKMGEQQIITVDPKLSSEHAYPPLPPTTDPNRIEEIRRTVLVTGLESNTTPQQVISYFEPDLEVKFARMATGDGGRIGCFVEFSCQTSIAKALAMSGGVINDGPAVVQHATCAIIKPATMYGVDPKTSFFTESAPGSRQAGRSSSRRSRSRSSRRSRHSERRRSRSRHSHRRRSSRSRSRSRRSSRDRDRDRDRDRKRIAEAAEEAKNEASEEKTEAQQQQEPQAEAKVEATESANDSSMDTS